jgi:hypothetical protein
MQRFPSPAPTDSPDALDGGDKLREGADVIAVKAAW